MADLSQTQSAAERAAAIAAIPAPPDAATILAQQQAAMADHWSRVICTWCSCDSMASAGQSLTLNVVNQVSAATIAQWTADLQAKGYVVTVTDNLFTVAMP
jgi:hypothetical protein